MVDQPVIHHYSWAKTKAELETKIKTWGHRDDDTDWQAVIDWAFSDEFDYTVPFNGYTLTKVESFL